MQPKLELLTPDLVSKILDEAFQLLRAPGIKVQDAKARDLLAAEGASVDNDIVHLSEKTVRKALETVPATFHLHDRFGNRAVTYGGNVVHFDPGSSGVHILDPETLEHKPSTTPDLVTLVKITEMLPAYDAQSTAVVCSEVPKAIGDLYRLYIVLLHSLKPVVTGAFSVTTLHTMIDMMAVYSGGRDALAEKPQAVFDVCPSPPLIWSEFGAGNLIELARARVPAELISMPLAGAASPVTLLGSLVQHAAENLSGIAIHQFASPGAPIVWGGAPAIFDMKHGTTPMGAVETAMIDVAYAQVGKSLNMPTHCYLGATDAKVVDAQAGLESGVTTMLGALAGINMISGAGMLDFLACQSAEKLILDAEAIGMAKRMLAGISQRTESLATIFYQGFNFKGDFLKQKLTRELFPVEQSMPSAVIDRDSIRGWQQSGRMDAFARATQRKNELLAAYLRPDLPLLEKELIAMVSYLARAAGMDDLPGMD